MKKRTTFALITSVSLRRDGLHMIAVGYDDRRTDKKKPTPTRVRASSATTPQ